MLHQSQECSGKIAAKKKERHQKWLNVAVDSGLGRPLGRLFFLKKEKQKEEKEEGYRIMCLTLSFWLNKNQKESPDAECLLNFSWPGIILAVDFWPLSTSF